MVGFNSVFWTHQKRPIIDREVSAISGHRSMQMLKRYTHLRAEDLVERLDQVIG